MNKKIFFVLGTGTGVGKTVFSLLLMHYFFKQGENPFYIKPFQTGCIDARDRDSDARLIYKSIPQLQGNDPGDSVIYCLKSAKAPYFAAKDQNCSIDMERVISVIREKADSHAPLIVEAAGGVHVPVTDKHLIIDLVEATEARPLVVAHAGLGTINHCLLTLAALKHRGLEDPGLVFVRHPNDPTSPSMIQENMDAIALFSKVRVAGIIPPITDFAHPDPDVFGVIDRLIR